MGYFVYAYVVEGTADNEGVSLATSVYTHHLDRPAFFSWSEGKRSPGLRGYAGGTLYSDAGLLLLPGYPRAERRGDQPGEGPDLVLLEESFTPREDAEPVLFHFVLPPRFVPRPDRTPLVTPSDPSVIRHGSALSATFVAKGGGDVRFWISRLAGQESLDDYDLTRIFKASPIRSPKVSFKLNLGIVEIAFGDS